MKTEVKDPLLLTQQEEESLAVEVLQLLDGLGVGAIAVVLNSAAGFARTYTVFDFKAVAFAQAIEALPQNAG